MVHLYWHYQGTVPYGKKDDNEISINTSNRTKRQNIGQQQRHNIMQWPLFWNDEHAYYDSTGIFTVDHHMINNTHSNDNKCLMSDIWGNIWK